MKVDRWLVVALFYACAVGGLGLAGDITGDPRFLLAAFLGTLPLAVPAFIGVYLGYGLMSGIGGLLLSTTAADGSEAEWLTATRMTLLVLLPMVAAVGNVLLTRMVVQSRARRKHTAPLHGRVTGPPFSP